MSEENKVTVVIPTYNRAHLIHQAIDSVLKQTHQYWNLLIIDDASTDHTKEIIETYQKQNDRITYFCMPQNMGIGHVLNKALQLVKTEYMLQLDSDDWLEEQCIEKLLNAMEKEPHSTALAYGKYMRWRSLDKRKLRKAESFHSDKKCKLLTSGTVYPRFYRTSCLRYVNGWDVSDYYGGRHLEDLQIMYKLIEHYNFHWVDEYLYNLSRLNKERLTKKVNVYKYNELRKDLVIKKLNEWGCGYTPEFVYNGRWLNVRLKE
ncbi:glycosyltransferase family 2 protein [Cytobacillus firmus]|uniref:glycosyltransferase family 2 protein n=1 Tax=Cytobacillus firmus TaxID=1399 RepID=UPI001C8D22B1|nr:glycosyltransferase family 2 protein [Cytobacillus firmus]MBX9972597.1 glycosyltransferase family 2 protein [Cytobacillus firmus]